jgi:hypothetical protein
MVLFQIKHLLQTGSGMVTVDVSLEPVDVIVTETEIILKPILKITEAA